MSHYLGIGSFLIGSYLLGSLPFGLWIGALWKGIDIRTLGSGNIGSTNVWRVCGPLPGTIAFCLDVMKGLTPPVVCGWLGLPPEYGVGAALLAIGGHNYSIWLGFKGGKGIATSLGALLGVAPPVAVAAFAIWALEVAVVGYVSLGSILGAVSLLPLTAAFYPHDGVRMAFAALACVLAIYRHKSNIVRLVRGAEPRVRSILRPGRASDEGTTPATGNRSPGPDGGHDA